MGASFRALKSRNYRLWVSGTVVSNTGTWVQRTSQDWLVLTVLTHHSGLATGITTGLQFAPLLFFSPQAGVLADRFPKRRLLFITQSLMGFSALLIGLLVVTGVVRLWEVFACALLLGCGTALDNPVRQSFVSEVVPRSDVASAVSMNSASINAARLIGPGVAGLIIAAWGTGPGFLINAASFVAVLIALARMRPQDMYRSDRLPRGKGQIREGLRFVRQRPDLLLIFVMTGLVGTFAMNFQITNALMASGAFHRGAREYGLLGSAMAIGCLAAAVLNARREQPRLRLLIIAEAGLGACMVVGALLPTYFLYAVSLVFMGLGSITVLNSCNIAVQLSTPAHLRGRVLSLYLAIQIGTTPIGAPIVGWLGSEFGARWSVLTGGFAALLAGACGVIVLAVRPGIGTHFTDALHSQRVEEQALATTDVRPALRSRTA
ncbi:MAG TPA: MFS transporter [Pseudonocardiaceae bacterium]